MTKRSFIIAPASNGNWQIKEEVACCEPIECTHSSREQCEKTAVALCKDLETKGTCCELKTCDKDGKVTHRHTYGKEPVVSR